MNASRSGSRSGEESERGVYTGLVSVGEQREERISNFEFQLWPLVFVFVFLVHCRANANHYFVWIGIITDFTLGIVVAWLDVDVQAGGLM